MSEEFIRHFISFIAAFVCLLAFFAGYKSGQLGWWWSGFFVIVVYLGVYKILEV